MARSTLPERASLDFLKKLAKERLRELRAQNPAAKLTAAQLALAREYGFSSWRELKAEIDRRQGSKVDAVFDACLAGDAAALRPLLDADPGLAHARRKGSSALHAAVISAECVHLLLARGADPNARDDGDNASPLHFAAARGSLDVVRLLLGAGADVHGRGDAHGGDVIGWAVGSGQSFDPAVVDLLLERGARHTIFSAIAVGDQDLVRSIVAEDPAALRRRRSRFEQAQSPLHFALASPNAIAPRTPQYDMARLLLELGADIEATDDMGRTPLAVAMLAGDLEAMRLLEAAGARRPAAIHVQPSEAMNTSLRESMYKQVTPMLCVADPDATVALYTSIGFTLDARVPEAGPISWAALSLGNVHIMVQERVARPHDMIALWFHTSRIDDLYALFRNRQLQAAQAALAGDPDATATFPFKEDLYSPHYGGRQFSVSDPNGFELVFQSE